MNPAERLSAIRRDLREKDWVARRISSCREERQLVEGKLQVARRACGYLQADGARLTRGIASMLRGRTASDEEQLQEVQRLAAAQLLCQELEEDLRAIDADLRQLEARAAAVQGADAAYESLIRELSDAARGRGLWSQELEALDTTEDELRAQRREIEQAISDGLAAHEQLVALLDTVRRIFPPDDDGKFIGEVVLMLALGKTADAHRVVTEAIAAAHHAVSLFRHRCQHLSDPHQLRLQARFPEVGSFFKFIVRDALTSNDHLSQHIIAEMSRLSDVVTEAVLELRSQAQRLEVARAQLLETRATLVDPPRDRL